MPESVDILDSLVEDFIVSRGKDSRRFLDVGAGTGKFGKMVKEHLPEAFVEAVEIDLAYVVNYGLEAVYDYIYQMDVGKFIDCYPDYQCDVCIIGDCLEHLRKSVGVDVLNFFVYRTKYIVATFPDRMPQGSWAGHKQEAHISVWDEQDFSLFECTYTAKSFMRLAIVKGYRR